MRFLLRRSRNGSRPCSESRMQARVNWLGLGPPAARTPARPQQPQGHHKHTPTRPWAVWQLDTTTHAPCSQRLPLFHPSSCPPPPGQSFHPSEKSSGLRHSFHRAGQPGQWRVGNVAKKLGTGGSWGGSWNGSPPAWPWPRPRQASSNGSSVLSGQQSSELPGAGAARPRRPTQLIIDRPTPKRGSQAPPLNHASPTPVPIDPPRHISPLPVARRPKIAHHV